MKHVHKSHHIFIYLGILVLIFILFFGIQYFRSEYAIYEVDNPQESQNFEDGVATENPFLVALDEEQNMQSWKKFGSSKMSFMYPGNYALRVQDEEHVLIAPNEKTLKNCEKEEKADNPSCLPMSPLLSIQIDDTENVDSSLEKRTSTEINHQLWEKYMHQDRSGGIIEYRKKLANGKFLELSFRYQDVLDGTSFETLHTRYPERYLLSRSEQNTLAMNIMASITTY